MDTDRAEGVLLGLACGDSLGRPVEFASAGQIAADHGTLTEMIGYGTWNQPAGTLTDDTEQALCIARSLVDRGTFDPADVAERFVEWYDSEPFDIGIMTRESIAALKAGSPWDEAGHQVWEASAEGANAGNGSVMRCPPLALAFPDDPTTLDRVSRDSSRITHADPRCTCGCAVLNLTIAGVLQDEPDPLRKAIAHVRSNAPNELVTALDQIANGGGIESLSTSGYVIDSLQTGLHDALRADAADEAIITAVNRGGDTDRIGAITGAVAGARFGASALPKRWIDSIDEGRELTRLAVQLRDL